MVSGNSFVSAANTNVSMSINPGIVSINQPGSLTFATALNVSFNAQTLQQAFTGVPNYFIVSDLKAADSGYNTTLQMSGNLTTGSYVISGSNVLFRASGSINVTSGSSNVRVVLDAGTTGFQALNTSRSFIRRNTAANFGVIGQYGANIELRVDVPAYQPAGAYAGILVYTLIEN